MRIKKSILIASTVAAVGLGTIGASALAQNSNGGTTSLVDKIAQKFNLNKDEVQKVFDQNKADRQAEMEARYEDRLSQAVKDGKLTEEQKTKILAKHKELQAKFEAQREAGKDARAELENKTEAERKALMEQKKAELDKLKSEIEAWEKENNIPSGYLMVGLGGHGMHGGFDGHGPAMMR